MKEMIQFESQVMVFKFLHLCPHLNHTEPLFQSHFDNKLFFLLFCIYLFEGNLFYTYNEFMLQGMRIKAIELCSDISLSC